MFLFRTFAGHVRREESFSGEKAGWGAGPLRRRSSCPGPPGPDSHLPFSQVPGTYTRKERVFFFSRGTVFVSQ